MNIENIFSNSGGEFVTPHIEIIEKLEQLRLLENGIPIHVVITNYKSMGVDRPEDIETVTRILEKT